MSDHGNSTTPTIQVPAPLSGRRKTAPVSSLVGVRLPTWAPYAAGAGGVAVALGLRWLLSWTGWGTAFWMAALLFVVGCGHLPSRVVGGRRTGWRPR